MESVQDSVLVVACQQLRMHNSAQLRLYLHVTSTGIIERCEHVSVAPYPAYNNLEWFASAELDEHKNNNWSDLKDFNWLASGDHQQSPNWRVMPQGERQELVVE